MIFGIKEKLKMLTHTMYFWLIATNIPQRLKTGFVVQGHILQRFLKNHVTLKTGVMAAENSAFHHRN